jgi:hypothetical protein
MTTRGAGLMATKGAGLMATRGGGLMATRGAGLMAGAHPPARKASAGGWGSDAC